MSKRFFSVALSFLGSVFLMGCEKVTELTDEETALVAEYAAEMLLKYDLNYVDRIVEGDKQVAEMTGDSSDQTEPADTQTDTGSAGNSTQKEPSKQEQTEQETEHTQDTISSDTDLASILGLSGVTITGTDYLLTTQYPEDGDVDLQTSDGYQFLVLQFGIRNVSDGEVSVSLLDQQVDYSVRYGTGSAGAMLTILPQDLGTLETSLSSGEQQEAVLVFQIPEGITQPESIELLIQYNGTNHTIKIL